MEIHSLSGNGNTQALLFVRELAFLFGIKALSHFKYGDIAVLKVLILLHNG